MLLRCQRSYGIVDETDAIHLGGTMPSDYRMQSQNSCLETPFSPAFALHIPRKRSVLMISQLGVDSGVTFVWKSIHLEFAII